jgi:hypothetical protein
VIFHTWYYFDLFTLVFFVSLLLRLRKLKLHDWIIAAVFFWLAYSLMKNSGYFIFAVLPLMLRTETEFKKKKKESAVNAKINFVFQHAKKIRIAFLVICFLLILTVPTNAFYINYRSVYRFGFGMSNFPIPSKAVSFMNNKQIRGKILNHLDFGGYIEFFGNQKASIDGRLEVMQEKIFEEQVLAANDESKTILLQKLNPQIILVSYSTTPDWINYLKPNPEWRLVYADGNAALWLKNGFCEHVPALVEKDFLKQYKNYSPQSLDNLLQGGKSKPLLSSFYQTQYYPSQELNLTTLCLYYGWFDAARCFAAEAFIKSTKEYPDLYQNAGIVYFQMQDKERSLRWLSKYLESQKNERVEKAVKFLKTVN